MRRVTQTELVVTGLTMLVGRLLLVTSILAAVWVAAH